MKKLNVSNCVALALLVLLSGAQPGGATPDDSRIDINGDFELDEDRNGMPDNWRTWVREGHEEEVSFTCDSSESIQGASSIRIDNRGDGSSCYYLASPLELSSMTGLVYELKGYMKARGLEGGRAGVRVGTLNREGKREREYVRISTNGSHDWRLVRASFAIPEDVISVEIRFILEGRGTIWFDGFELSSRKISGDDYFRRGGKWFFKIYEDPHAEIIQEHPDKWLLLLPHDPDSLWAEETVYAGSKAKKTIFAAPKEKKTFAWGVYSPKKRATISLKVTDLIQSKTEEIIPQDCIDIRRVHYWDQRRDWRSAGYSNIPELVMPVAEGALGETGFGHYWTTISIPEAQPPGDYQGQIEIMEGGQTKKTIDLNLTILPFELTDPAKDWGLWVDSPRWERYSSEEIKEELKSIRSHGFTMLSIGMLRPKDFSVRNGRLSIDLKEMDRYIQLISRSGFHEPLVFSIQHSQDQIRALYRREGIQLNRRSFEDAYRGLLEIMKTIQLERNWPSVTIAVYDEVHTKPERVQSEAQYLYGLVKSAGFSTCATSDLDVVKEKFKDLIDIRIFNMQVLGLSDKDNWRVRMDVRKGSEPFWWYGSGCYSGQEGRILPNRYLSGFFLWKSGADGQWSWTFQRPRADPFDDFDGEAESPREPKDACMTYPLKQGNGFVPTLQWEAVREGMTDMAYVATLEWYIDLARRSLSREVVERASRTEEQLEKIKAEIPWLHEPGFSNRKADMYRSEIARQIVVLKRMMEKGEHE